MYKVLKLDRAGKLVSRKSSSMEKPSAYLDYRLFVPASAVRQEWLSEFEDIIEDFFSEIDEQGNRRENRDLRLQHYMTHPEGWVSFTRGDLGKIKEVLLPHLNIQDNRAVRPLPMNIEWVGVKSDSGAMVDLRENQVDTIGTLLYHGYGQLQAPPRYGKTICMTNIITQLNQKTLVLAHQVELLEQFEEKFRDCTNIRDLEQRAGRRLVGLCETREQFKQYAVCCATWQGFLPGNANSKLLTELKDEFGVVLVDEAHRSASDCFSKVVAKFNPRYRFGFTATPDRKDGLEAVVENIIGPVMAAGDVAQIPMRVRPVYTGFHPVFQRWHAYERQIKDNTARNKLIIKNVVADVDAGHSVLIVATRKEHIKDLVSILNRNYGIPAEGWYSDVKDRAGVLGRARAGTTKVIVAMRSMLLGLNVPRWSSIHITVPSNNPYNFYQEFARVRTPMEGKPFCVVRDYVDNHKAALACFKTRFRVYTNAMHAPVYFEDSLGNVVNQPTFRAIEELALRDSEQIELEDLRAQGVPVVRRGIFQNKVGPVLKEPPEVAKKPATKDEDDMPFASPVRGKRTTNSANTESPLGKSPQEKLAARRNALKENL